MCKLFVLCKSSKVVVVDAVLRKQVIGPFSWSGLSYSSHTLKNSSFKILFETVKNMHVLLS